MFIVNENKPTPAAEFLHKVYGLYFPERYVTFDKIDSIKELNGIDEWDYPLEEKDHILSIAEEFGTEYELVQFADGTLRYCELPEKEDMPCAQ